MVPRCPVFLAFLLLFVVACSAAGDSAKRVMAVRCATPPVIDGILRDGVWRAAEPATDFTQRDPDEGTPASEQTEIRVLYDDTALYSADAGIDLKLGIGNTLTLDATVNPDFGQVEADPAVLNLSTFETFYPERRPFFVEGTQIIRSRRSGMTRAFQAGCPVGFLRGWHRDVRVWSQARGAEGDQYFTTSHDDLRETFRVPPANVILVEVSYWWGG